MIRFDPMRLWLTLSNLAAARIRYERSKGAGKVGTLSTEPATLHRRRAGIDCSGYVQYVVYQGSSNHQRIPAGSVRQREWLDESGFTAFSGNSFVGPDDVYLYEAGKIDDIVRIGFRKTDARLKKQSETTGSRGAGVGHVWLILNRRTYECTTKRPANGPASFGYEIRAEECDALFKLGPAAGFAALGPLLQPV